jgi:hypothetical protein
MHLVASILKLAVAVDVAAHFDPGCYLDLVLMFQLAMLMLMFVRSTK